MTIKKFEVFYTVAKTLSMTQAAKQLYVSQPSISQFIKDLEDTLQTPLFQRRGKKLILTREGEIFKSYSLRILNLYKESLTVLSDMNQLKRGIIKIGASTTIGTYIMPDIVSSFIDDHSNIKIDLIIDNTEIIKQELLKNNIDFAFIEGPIEAPELIQEKIWSDELVIISSKEKRIKNTISLKDLEKETFIIRESGSGSRGVFENKIDSAKFKDYFIFGNIEAIKKAVIKNMGVSFVSKFAIKDELRNNLINASYIENLKLNRDLKVIYHKDKKFNTLFKVFIESCKDYKFY